MPSPSLPSDAAAEANDPSTRRQWFVNAYVALIVVVNVFILWRMWEDKSWGALWLACFGGPIANGTLSLVGALTLAFRRARNWPTATFGGVSMVFLPLLAIGLDLVVLSKMPHSGGC